MAALNEVNPSKSCTFMILPDNARESSLRGLFDEERQIFEELFSLAQACDTRWIDLYARETRSADHRSNSRKFGTGRIVTSSTMLSENEWLKSELAVYGRVVGVNESTEGAPLAVLPRTASILIPESSSPDSLLSQESRCCRMLKFTSLVLFDPGPGFSFICAIPFPRFF